ncbi:MAG: hypothetical protein UEE41_06895 [Acutalibacteraceae bacterium]|nr:hypothetical protein [Acutalibacteraceae bacterium]
MKQQEKEKKFHIVGLLVTLLISVAILGFGYILISSLQYWIPSYKDNMTYMGEENVQMQPLYWNREEEITIYPWGLYKNDAVTTLTKDDEIFLREIHISTLLHQATQTNKETDFISHFQKVTSNNVSVYFLKDFECTGHSFSKENFEESSIADKMYYVSNSTEKQTKVVNCALDQYGQVLYLHVADKESLQKSADRTQIEEAYNQFTISKESDDTAEGDIVNAAAMDLYNLFLSNPYQDKAIVALENFLYFDNRSYDVVIQDQQILLIYTLDSGYRFIFIYNVPMEQIAGMSLEKLSV